MTVGITPTGPETGFGYLQCGPAENGVMTVAEFKEKPSHDVAVEYLRTGRYLWNAGMFVWRVEAFLAELARQQPVLSEGLHTIAEAWGTPDQDRVLGDTWPTLPKISVDYAVMEGAADAGLVSTVPGDFGWTDVGDFDALGDVLSEAEQADAGRQRRDRRRPPRPVLRDCSGSVVIARSGPGRVDAGRAGHHRRRHPGRAAGL
jgi:mannose-1-phosphate guanylyltransferase